MLHYYPPPGFHFLVNVDGLTGFNDVRFTDVSGLSMEMATEEVPEGGENRFVQKYPLRTKYPDLVLKRGLLSRSGVFDWMRDCIQDYKIVPRDVNVMLLNELHMPLVTWHLVKAYPTKWAVSDLNAASNTVVVETLQMFYQYFTVDAIPVPPMPALP
jgi:phage tail-like protein